MNKVILLDASLLGMISNPSANLKCRELIFDFAKMTYNIIQPEDVNYAEEKRNNAKLKR